MMNKLKSPFCVNQPIDIGPKIKPNQLVTSIQNTYIQILNNSKETRYVRTVYLYNTIHNVLTVCMSV